VLTALGCEKAQKYRRIAFPDSAKSAHLPQNETGGFRSQGNEPAIFYASHSNWFGAYSLLRSGSLAGGKKLIIASSPGGFYTASSPMAFMDHQETFLTSFFGFIGVSDTAFIRAEGVGLGPEQRKLALETALAEISALKAA
jgi:hypothetical protein